MRARKLPAPGWTTWTQSGAVILTQLAYHRAGSLPLLCEGGSGSRYTDGATGKSIHRQVIQTYLLIEAVAEIGIEEGFKAWERTLRGCGVMVSGALPAATVS